MKLEFTRAEQFTAATTRHPMRVSVKLGAKRDGTLTAIEMCVVSNTGAYGNHGLAVLEHACAELIAVDNCPNKKVDGYAVYTNTVPAGGMRGYGLPQTNFAVESAIDEVARTIGMDGLDIRRLNAIWQGDAMLSTGEVHDDVIYGSYGLDQCFDLMARKPPHDGGEASPWTALADRPGLCTQPRQHYPARRALLRFVSFIAVKARRGHMSSPSAPPNSATAPPPCTGRSRPRCSRPRPPTFICGRRIPAMAAMTLAPSARPAPSSPAAPPSARRVLYAT